MLSRRDRLIALNLAPEVGSTALRRLLDAFGGMDQLWAAPVQALRDVVSPRAAERIAAVRADPARLARELEDAASAGVTILTLDDPAYPARLKEIADPPLALYVRGTLAGLAAPAVAVVGSREASPYGIEIAAQLSAGLARQGITVVSGLARGIDGAAHEGVLAAGGCPVAVLGNGLATIYPPEHETLAGRIAEHGAVVSEYPMATPPNGYNFPRRNRIISGLALGVVVVEAAARSGALITADCALEQGREVFAVPGPMTSATSEGTHRLIKQGARLVTSVEDILEELHLTPAPTRATLAPQEEPLPELPEDERRVFACLDARSPVHIDAVAEASGLVMPEVSSLLLQLELKQLVRQLPGKQFVKMSGWTSR